MIPITAFGLDRDVPVWSTLNLAAGALVLTALVALFRFGFGAVTGLT